MSHDGKVQKICTEHNIDFLEVAGVADQYIEDGPKRGWLCDFAAKACGHDLNYCQWTMDFLLSFY